MKKQRKLFSPLLKRLLKIYFSKSSYKEVEYKKAIYDCLYNLGGVYIKFLQVLCVTQKFIEGWGGPKETEIFNQVKSEKIDLKDYIDIDQFESFEDEPFACGSFAQIYRGNLKSGEKVAIKILRPSIENHLKSDLKILRKLVKLFDFFIPNGMLDYESAFKEFSKSCIQETDYQREMANMQYFYNFYKNYDKVVIPKLYRELSRKNVIVQEFINGPTLADVTASINSNESLEEKVFSMTGSNVWNQIIVAGGEALRLSMEADYVFGDPHPGNIILLSEDRIAFVDFGIIANRPTSQEAFYRWTRSYYNILKGGGDYGDLMKSTCMCFCPDYVNALKKCSNSDEDIIDKIASSLTEKAKKIEGENKDAENFANSGHILKLFTEFIDNKNSLNIKIDMRNFRLLKAMQAFISSITTIDNKYGDGNFAKIMIASMEYAFEKCSPQSISHDMTYKTRYSINECYELLIDMITNLANNDEFLYENISERMFL